MKFGLFAMNMGPCADPGMAARVARQAEAAGFESLWVGEHVVLPVPQAPPSPMAATHPFLDPVVSLTWLAAHTTRVRLGTGIVILPQRNPVILAKELASLDVLSGGRLILGVGAGYLEPEFRAVGAEFAHRGPRTVEFIEAMRALWGDAPRYDGRFVRFEGVDAFPKPAQGTGVPVVVGGMSDAAFRRVVEHAHGWYGFALDPEGTERAIARLRQAERRLARDPALGPIEISVTPRGGTGREDVERFAAAGVDRLILLPGGSLGGEDVERFVDEAAGTLLA